MDIDIQISQDAIIFTEKMDELVRCVIEKTFEHEKVSPLDVSVVITDDEEIQRLNKEFRGKDAPTNVLSFPMYDEDGALDDEVLGDIVISLERAKIQADEYGHSLERELAFLTVHSMLHLFGYDHETGKEDEKEMFSKQEEILSLLGLERK
ncbi:MAG: rRNA maturation RNase YbeY [Eubacteriales bacterium]|nr:rRNA maturation RNase YbeY [Eubacteriales bacterium]